MSLRLYYCDHHPIPLPPGHKFPLEKYALLRGILAADGFHDMRPSPFAKVDEIEAAHSSDYVSAFIAGNLAPSVMRRIGLPWSEGLVQRTLASAGGTLAAARDAFQLGIAGNLAGGTHHAFRDFGAGFCVFNDIAIAINVLRREGLIHRAAVIDLDVHQGDGTAAIFEHDENILTISLHGEHNFPFRKQRSQIDIGLPDGIEDAEYLEYLTTVLPRVRTFRPDVVFYQSGVDGLREDRLGRLCLTFEGLRERDRYVFELTKGLGAPAVITLGGGYADPIALTAAAHANTFRTALVIYSPVATDLQVTAS